MKRIALVAPFPPSADGVAYYTACVARALAKMDNSLDVLVLATDSSNGPQSETLEKNLRVIRVGGKRVGPIRILARLAYHLVRLRPEVVHFQSGLRKEFGGVFGEAGLLLLTLLKLVGQRVIVSVHSTWWKEDVEALALSKRLPAPLHRAFALYYVIVHRIFYSLCAAVSVVTVDQPTAGFEAEMERWRRTYGISSTKLCYEFHPCEAPRMKSGNDSPRAPEGEMTQDIVSVGFIRRDKGFHVLLQAADQILDRFSNARIITAGYPPRPEDKAYAQDLARLRQALRNADRVILHFRILSEEEFEKYLDNAAVVVLPYLEVRAPSGPLHRALGRGKIVVASGVGHNLALSGIIPLVPPGDPRSLANEVIRILRDPSVARSFQSNAVRFALAHSWEALARQYRYMYQSVGRDVHHG